MSVYGDTLERRKTLWLQRELCEVNSLTEVMSVESYFTLMLDSKVLDYCVNKKAECDHLLILFGTGKQPTDGI